MNHCKDEKTAQNSSSENTDINQSFGCRLLTASVGEYLSRFAFVIPSYQRQYRWAGEETERLCTEMYGYYQDTISEFVKLSESGKGQMQGVFLHSVRDSITERMRNYGHTGVNTSNSIVQTETKQRIIDNLKPSNKFVGTLILVEDRPVSDQTVNAEELLYGVIDGQQRLTTFCLFVACLCYRLNMYRQYFVSVRWKYEKRKQGLDQSAGDDLRYGYLIDCLNGMCKTLQGCLAHSLTDKKTERKFDWPTICREKEDQRDQQGNKHSDTWNFCAYVDLYEREYCDEKVFKSYLEEGLSKGKNAELIVQELEENLKRNTEKELLKECYKNHEIPESIEKAAETIGAFLDLVAWRPWNEKSCIWDTKKLPKELAQRSLTYSIDMPKPTIQHKDICRFSGEKEGRNDFGFKDAVLECNDENIESFLRLVSFGRYVLKNVFMAAVVCQPDNFLDIFESLNSAGRPLTSIETFIPRVHKFFSLQALSSSTNEGGSSYLAQKIWESSINENQDKFQGLKQCQKVSPEDYLTAIKKLIEFQPNVDSENVVISFALLLRGVKCGRSANDQKKFLERTFSEAEKRYRDDEKAKGFDNSFESIRLYINGLYQTTKWWCMLSETKDNKARFESLFSCSEAEKNALSTKIDQAKLCLAMMLDAKFLLPLTVACRFYIQFLDCENDSRQFGEFFKDKNKSTRECQEYLKEVRHQSFEYYLDVICSLAAFTGIWRSLYPGTNGIEAAFREIIEGRNNGSQRRAGRESWAKLTISAGNGSDSDVSANEHTKIRDKFGLIKADEVRYRLRTLLNEKMSINPDKLTDTDGFTLKKWQEKLRTSKTGSVNKIPRFLLLTYMTNSESDPNSKLAGLRRYRKGAGKNCLTYSSWARDYNSTDYQVEHVIPQANKGTEWKKELNGLNKEECENLVHELGNLLLLPARGNNLIKNKAWKFKKIAYQCMGTHDPKKYDELQEKLNLKTLAQDLGEDFSKVRTRDALKSLLNELATDAVIEFDNGPKDWNREFVHQRSDRMVEVIWQNFEPFLQLNKIEKEWKDLREKQEQERNSKKRSSAEMPSNENTGGAGKKAVDESNPPVDESTAETSGPSFRADDKISQRRKQKAANSSGHEKITKREGRRSRTSGDDKQPSSTTVVSQGKVASEIVRIISKFVPNADKTDEAWVWRAENGDEVRLTFESEKLKLYIPKIHADRRLRGYRRMKVDEKGWKLEFNDPEDWNKEDSASLSQFCTRNFRSDP